MARRSQPIHHEPHDFGDDASGGIPIKRVYHLPALIAEEFGGSRSAVRRVIYQGGVRVNGEVVEEMDYTGTIYTIQVGKETQRLGPGTDT